MNKKLLVVLVLAVVIGGGVWAYFATRPNASAPQSSGDTNRSRDDTHGHGDAVAGTEITYTDTGFSPAHLTAKKGTTITIKNSSSGPLDFSSDDHPTHTKHPEFNLTTVAAGDEIKLELKTTGVWGYHNHLKAADSGMITVTE